MRYGKALLSIAIIGIIISVYLTIEHYAPQVLYCPGAGALIDCATVLSSRYSTVFGIPISLGALVWFAVVALLSVRKPGWTAKGLWVIAGIGGLTYSIAAMAVIGKICVWCSVLDVLIVATIALFMS